MRRLRRADWVVLWSALFAAASLSAYWFHVDAVHVPPDYVGYAPLSENTTGWDGLGWVTGTLILVTAALGVAVVALIAAGARDAVNVPPAVVLMALTPVTLIVTIIVTLSKTGGRTTLDTSGWTGLAALAALKAGAWFSMRDERLDQPARQVEPPPARPAPPAA